MKILFLSVSSAVRNIQNRGIYPDLLRTFLKYGHEVFIVSPLERRNNEKTFYKKEGKLHTLSVWTPNFVKTSRIEKTITSFFISFLFKRSIQKYFPAVQFDLILYATPPITFTPLIKQLKRNHIAKTYLLLKDMFPQNAIDLGFFSGNGIVAKYFRRKEVELYKVSDHIGCMSPANKAYVLDRNPYIKPSQVGVCPNSIELTNIPPADKKSVRDNYNLPQDKVIAIYGGNLGKPQGIPFLIEILKANKDEPNLFFVIAGNGTEFSKIQTFLKNTSIPNVLLIPSLPRNAFDELVQVCDIGLVFLDRRFTIPNFPSRILNYMEFKLPILFATDKNTDVGRIAEENSFGLWSESGDLQGFNRNLLELCRDQEIRFEMGEKGYEYLKQNYLTENSYEVIMNAIKTK